MSEIVEARVMAVERVLSRGMLERTEYNYGRRDTAPSLMDLAREIAALFPAADQARGENG